jgi:MerR family transcriptional regulator, light-induced transcriptional regulator
MMRTREVTADMGQTVSRAEVDMYQAVPAESARVYRDRMFFLLEQVNRYMDLRDDIDRLIGNNPRSRMYDNHRNHAAFMATVFALNNYGLLLAVVPWVYRAYVNQGFMYEYFPVHLGAWRKVLQEHLSRADAEPLVDVYDRLMASHETFIVASREISFLEIPTDSRREEVTARFLEELLRGDSAPCRPGYGPGF